MKKEVTAARGSDVTSGIDARAGKIVLPPRLQTPIAVQLLTFLVVLGAWEFIGRSGILFAELFPPISEILQSLWRYLTTPLLLSHLKASLYEVGGALGVAIL